MRRLSRRRAARDRRRAPGRFPHPVHHRGQRGERAPRDAGHRGRHLVGGAPRHLPPHRQRAGRGAADRAQRAGQARTAPHRRVRAAGLRPGHAHPGRVPGRGGGDRLPFPGPRTARARPDPPVACARGRQRRGPRQRVARVPRRRGVGIRDLGPVVPRVPGLERGAEVEGAGRAGLVGGAGPGRRTAGPRRPSPSRAGRGEDRGPRQALADRRYVRGGGGRRVPRRGGSRRRTGSSSDGSGPSSTPSAPGGSPRA